MFAVTFLCGASMFAACSIGDDDNPVGDDPTGQSVEVQQLSTQMAAVRDYVPLYAVLAHRGSTYWTPEETESAWRWAREMGADYLELTALVVFAVQTAISGWWLRWFRFGPLEWIWRMLTYGSYFKIC